MQSLIFTENSKSFSIFLEIPSPILQLGKRILSKKFENNTPIRHHCTFPPCHFHSKFFHNMCFGNYLTTFLIHFTVTKFSTQMQYSFTCWSTTLSRLPYFSIFPCRRKRLMQLPVSTFEASWEDVMSLFSRRRQWLTTAFNTVNHRHLMIYDNN